MEQKQTAQYKKIFKVFRDIQERYIRRYVLECFGPLQLVGQFSGARQKKLSFAVRPKPEA
jgi:hypothetical protein